MLYAGDSNVEISGAGTHDVIEHFGYGTLRLQAVSVTTGLLETSGDATGACIWSRGSVYMLRSTARNCELYSHSNAARGGAIYVRNNLTLVDSQVEDNRAYSSTPSQVYGGGVFVGGDFKASDSIIARNIARGAGSGIGLGGGAYVLGNVDIEESTIAGNKADSAGALECPIAGHTAKIINSTISGNVGTLEFGGVWTAIPLQLENSTIAFNRSEQGPAAYADGVFAFNAPLTLKSSIIADNMGRDGPSDVGASAGVVITGAAPNLIVQGAPGVQLPANTIGDCPRLDALSEQRLFWDGPTPTHGLRSQSAALDQGDAGTLTTDQRGAPRTVGVATDIGSLERQPSDRDDRLLSSSFEGPCDI